MDGGGCARCYRNSGPISYKSIRLRGRESLVQLEQVLHKRGGGGCTNKKQRTKNGANSQGFHSEGFPFNFSITTLVIVLNKES
jgi:hypothetical protein